MTESKPPVNELPPSSVADPLLKRIVERFEAESLPYVVIGGQAVIIHGHVRYTHDIDFTLGFPIFELDRVIRIRDQLGIKPAQEDSDEFARLSHVLHCLDPATGVGIDLSFVDSPYLVQAIERATVVEVLGQPVRFLNVVDLLVHKVIAGRAQDHTDVVELLNHGHDVDHGEVNRWLEQFEQVVEEELRERYAAWRREAEV